MNQENVDFTHERSDLDEVTTEFSVTVPAGTFQKRMDSEVTKLKPQVTIKGFRKGKAPANIIRKMHGERLRAEVSQRLVSETLYQALQKENIEETVGEPELLLGELSEEKDFSYTAKVFFPPKPEIKKYDSFSLEIEDNSVGDEEVDKAIEEISASQATFSTLEGRSKAEDGDVVKGTIRVTLEDEKEGEPEPLVVKLGDGRLPEDLEKGIIGMEVGTEKTISTKVSDEHRDESLRGKEAIYIVSLEELQQQNLPEVTDDFVKTLGMGAETVLELRLKIREQLEAQKEQQDQAEIHAQVLKQLLEDNSFAVPQSMVDSEIRALLVRQGLVDPQRVDVMRIPVQSFREQLGAVAEERVRTTIIVDRIVEQEGIEFGEEELSTVIQQIADEHSIPVPEVEKTLLADGRKVGFMREHQQKKALDLLRERTKITRKKKEK